MEDNLDKYQENDMEKSGCKSRFFTVQVGAKMVEILAALLIIMFVYAATSKILDLQKFQVELGKSPILNSFANVVSICIPVLELLIALLFFVRRSKQLAFYLSFALMVTFTAYVVVILNFSDYIPCSCGGVISRMTWNQHIVFNLFFVTISAMGVFLTPSTILSADKGGDRKP